MDLHRRRIGAMVFAAAMLAGAMGTNAEEQRFSPSISILGETKYPPDFKHFDYVNPDAPKGGALNLSYTGTFDSFNPILSKGNVAVGVAGTAVAPTSLVFETLLKSADDELFTLYGLLAEGISVAPEISAATFRLRAEAKWADGQPVTPEDVIFSFEKAKELNPLFLDYYAHVTKAEKTGERDVTFRFDEKNNRELPSILGQLAVLPKHWWEAKGPDGKPRDIAKTTLEPVMGSGPYKIAAFNPGSTIRYELRDDYWGRDLNVNRGQFNFRSVSYTYFADLNVQFEAFRAGTVDYWYDTQASRWATGYDFPAVREGRIKREELPNALRSTGVMQALVPNMRRDMFRDQRVREALNYALDFEEFNRTVFYNAYKRVDSYFFGTELASSGLPEGRELEILEGLKDKVPADVFTKPYANPVGGDPQKSRDNLRKAVSLFKEAGYDIKGGRMVERASGKPFSFEILIDSPLLERVAVPYTQTLQKIGIDARIRKVDNSQYVNRLRSFDYDMIWYVWGQTMNPGNEQGNYWGSSSVDRQGSRNYAGIADPAIDALIRMVIFAPNRSEQVAAVKALDRVLLAHHYVVPLYYSKSSRIAYWTRLARPETLPAYSFGFPDIWWSNEAK